MQNSNDKLRHLPEANGRIQRGDTNLNGEIKYDISLELPEPRIQNSELNCSGGSALSKAKFCYGNKLCSRIS